MDAIRIARGFTGRDTIMKIFGSYHGHHDYVMVSIGIPYDKIGDRENYASLPYGAGIPESVAQMTVPVPFNDAEAMERRIERLIKEDRKPACVIMEAAMMNLGVVLPEPGYLEAVREITRKHGKIASTVCGRDQIKDYADMGYNLLSVGADVVALAQYADASMEAFDKQLGTA